MGPKKAKRGQPAAQQEVAADAAPQAVAAEVAIHPKGHQHSPFDEPRASSSPRQQPSAVGSPKQESTPPLATSVPTTPVPAADSSIAGAATPKQPNTLPPLAPSPARDEECATAAAEDSAGAVVPSTPPPQPVDLNAKAALVSSPGASAITPCSTLPSTPQVEEERAAAPQTVAVPPLVLRLLSTLRVVALALLVYSICIASAAWQIISTRFPKIASKAESNVQLAIHIVSDRVEATWPIVQPKLQTIVERARAIDSSRFSGEIETAARSIFEALRTDVQAAIRR